MSAKNSQTFLPQILLSIITPTFVITRISGDNLIKLSENIGKASEEIFRGERLPILKDNG